jgi:transcriptional regulator with XRE-family HTH domain
MDMDNKYLILKDLKVLIEESEDSIDDIAKRAGVSSRTIDNILSGNVTPHNDIVDKIYSCAYDDGYRFNKIKEEIYKETYNEKVLFHGAS